VYNDDNNNSNDAETNEIGTETSMIYGVETSNVGTRGTALETAVCLGRFKIEIDNSIRIVFCFLFFFKQ